MISILVLSSISLLLILRIYFLVKENIALRNALIDSYLQKDSSNDSVQEQFLKFVSDSREWAFEYIENVQESIVDIVEFMTPVVINRDNREYNDRDILESVYKSLKKLLPE